MGPLKDELAAKFIRLNARGVKPEAAQQSKRPATMTQAISEKTTEFRLADTLMYGGQGKTNKVITPHCNMNLAMATTVDNMSTGEWAGLQPPKLEATGSVVRGDSKKQMRKENKLRRMRLKRGQTDTPQWTVHKGSTSPLAITEQDFLQYQNSMCPSGRAVAHPAANIVGNVRLPH